MHNLEYVVALVAVSIAQALLSADCTRDGRNPKQQIAATAQVV